MREAWPVRTAIAMAVIGLVLAGCRASTDLARPGLYRGDAALTRLADTRLTLENGTTVAFGEIFTDFNATAGRLARVFPFRSADIRLVDFASLREVLPKYDANEDRYLQEPELTTLYVHEAARGLGFAVVRVDPGGATGAIATSSADVSELMRFIDRHLHEFAPPQRRIFYDLYRLGHELRPRPLLLDDWPARRRW